MPLPRIVDKFEGIVKQT